ncbi:serine/threonine-protein phosphatase 2A regulatory subunit B [Paragonimus westermani]|uniref:Serine/threonine-protein phosphatase 2A regulatory subunit B n=1 Tax=Paragonimus westermani TaxID=34504 RepID=A0A5J4NA74_9TREM|nr:serine/threonine-protein phosphatase 2A regulatory subunit B [Paragonimus westermani]
MTSAYHLLSANDKTVKLWRLSERRTEAYNFNTRDDEGVASLWISPDNLDPSVTGPPIPTLRSTAELRVPRFRRAAHLAIESRPRRVYANAHMYHINAISLNSDQETFLSADDLRINLWHLDVSDQSFTIVDLKPPNMEDLSEVITCARFHPTQCHLLAYSTSRGLIRLCDMRVHALCDNHVLVFEDPTLLQNLGFFADIIASLSDFRFAHSGQYILARDYLTLKVWDIRMGDRPCELYPIHEPYRSQLCMLYENDAIFDKFLCSWSSDDRFITTGSYGNLYRAFDRHTGSDWLYDLSNSSNISSDADLINREPLVPMRFISPDDPIGSALGLSAIYVTAADSVASLMEGTSSSECNSSGVSDIETASREFMDESTTDLSKIGKDKSFVLDPVSSTVDTAYRSGFHPISDDDSVSSTVDSDPLPTGSKRRKQTLTARHGDDCGSEPTSTERDFRRRHKRKHLLPTSMVSKSGRNYSLANVGDTSNTSNTRTTSTPLHDSVVLPYDVQRVRERIEQRRSCLRDSQAVLSQLHQVDCQHKLLHIAWHPQLMKMVAVSDNHLFFMNGVSPASESLDLVPTESSDEEDINLEIHSLNGFRELRDTPSLGDVQIPPPPDARATKRRRHRRQYKTKESCSQSNNNNNPQTDNVSSSTSVFHAPTSLRMPHSTSISCVNILSNVTMNQQNRLVSASEDAGTLESSFCTENVSLPPLVSGAL